MATTYHISAIGEFQHPWFNKPDTAFNNDDGLYHTKLILEGADAENLKAKIEGASQSFLNEQTDEMKPADAKKWSLYTPFEDELDDAGEPTGRTVFTFKQNAKIRLRDGSVKEIKIELRDAADKVIDKAIYSGSEGRILFSMRGITMSSSRQAGVRLDFYKVQVTKLVQGGGSSKGFGAVEGGYEADAGDTGFGSADSDEGGDY